MITVRLLFVAALALFFSVAPTNSGLARANWEMTNQVSAPVAGKVVAASSEAPGGTDNQSWFQGDFPVTLDELAVATVAVATTFAAAAGSIALFVPPEAQLAVFASLVVVAATPIDGIIIGGGAIAAYRYFRDEPDGEDLEAFTPSWMDGWTYASPGEQ